MGNWKSPGQDGVQGYGIKRFGECRKAVQMKSLLNIGQITVELLRFGRTVLGLKSQYGRGLHAYILLDSSVEVFQCNSHRVNVRTSEKHVSCHMYRRVANVISKLTYLVLHRMLIDCLGKVWRSDGWN